MRDLILEIEYIGELAIITFRPDMPARVAIDQRQFAQPLLAAVVLLTLVVVALLGLGQPPPRRVGVNRGKNRGTRLR